MPCLNLLGQQKVLTCLRKTILSLLRIRAMLFCQMQKKAVFLITLMNFALGGKRVEKNLPPLTADYAGKGDSAKSAPSIGNHWGYLHSFLTGTKILDTLWINLLTHEQINEYRIWTSQLGVAPWEDMPKGENCKIAMNLKNSYMGCLIGLCRFVLFKNDGIYYVEGIQYPSHKNGWRANYGDK